MGGLELNDIYIQKIFEPEIKKNLSKDYNLVEYRGVCKNCGYTEALIYSTGGEKINKYTLRKFLKKHDPIIKTIEITDFICEKCFLEIWKNEVE